MCGEHVFDQNGNLLDKGSSPHVRGARNPTIQGSNRQGIIPACAGSTKCSSRTAPTSRDHPRMCGEHWRPHLHAVVEGGIIPACAGSTRPASGCPSCRRDHPRMCGEHCSGVLVFVPILGSSPHVRGAPGYDDVTVRKYGIIPACAGSTLANELGTHPLRDHPRMCGEHPSSSPAVVVLTGIIPVCAGSTSFDLSTLGLTGDHPRMCGEHTVTQWSAVNHTGSSPHVRGALTRLFSCLMECGIIPACAGSTRALSKLARFMGDHPRMCGEHLSFIPIKSFRRGSSPHVRGALAAKPTSAHTTGIIPACAGSTR